MPILARSLFIFRKPLCFPMCFLHLFLMFEKKLTGKGQRKMFGMYLNYVIYMDQSGKIGDKMRKECRKYLFYAFDLG